jgi:hypothetical protein
VTMVGAARHGIEAVAALRGAAARQAVATDGRRAQRSRKCERLALARRPQLMRVSLDANETS